MLICSNFDIHKAVGNQAEINQCFYSLINYTLATVKFYISEISKIIFVFHQHLFGDSSKQTVSGGEPSAEVSQR